MNHFTIKPGYSLLPMLLKVFSLLLLFVSAQSVAQTLTGTITNADGFAINLADVANSTTGVKTVTGTNGQFKITLNDGDNTILFYKDGYQLQELVVPSSQSEVSIILQKVTELNEVVIQKEKDKLFALSHMKDIDETAIYAGKKTEVISLDKITANKAVNNARQIFGQIVGLTINESSDGGLQLSIGGRGLDPNRTSNFNTRQNGYDISADVLGYPESYYTPPTEALEEIQVTRGAASLQYGTQFGGLVNFKLKSPTTKPIEVVSRATAGSYGLLTNFTSVSGTNGKFSYYTFFNYKQGDGFRPNSNFNSRNFFANINYQLNAKTSLHFDYTLFDYLAQQPGGLTDAMFHQDMFQSNRTRNWFDVNWNLFALRLKHKFTENANFSLQLFGLDASRKTVGYSTNRVSNPDTPGSVRDLITGKFINWGAETRFLQKYSFGSTTHALLLGAKYYQARNAATQGPGSTGSGPDFNFATKEFPNYKNQSDYIYPNINFSVFGENIFVVTPKLSITPGFRFENINTKAQGYKQLINLDQAGNVLLNQREDDRITKNRNFVLFGVGASYKPSTTFELYGNVSQNYRSVTFNDIHTVTPSLVIDPNITDEKGFTSDVGIRGRIDDRFSFDTSIYGLLYDDKIGQYLRSNPNGSGLPVSYRSNVGKAITYGWEAMGEWNISKTFFRENESFTWKAFVNNAITGSQYLKSNVPNIKGNKVEFVPLFNTKAGTSAGYKNFLASVQVSYLSSQFTDSGNSVTDTKDNTFGISGQIPTYYVADFSASYKWRRLKIEAGINNFTNHYYFTRRATGYPGPGIIPSDPRTFYTTLQITL